MNFKTIADQLVAENSGRRGFVRTCPTCRAFQEWDVHPSYGPREMWGKLYIVRERPCACPPEAIVPEVTEGASPWCVDCGGEVRGWTVRCSTCKQKREAEKQKVYNERHAAKKGSNALINQCSECGEPCRRKMCLPCSNQKHAVRGITGRSERDIEIIRRLAAGELPRAIAVDYDLTVTRVKQIKDRAA